MTCTRSAAPMPRPGLLHLPLDVDVVGASVDISEHPPAPAEIVIPVQAEPGVGTGAWQVCRPHRRRLVGPHAVVVVVEPGAAQHQVKGGPQVPAATLPVVLAVSPVMESVTATGRAVITQCAATDRQAIWLQGLMTEARRSGMNGYESAIGVLFPGDVCTRTRQGCFQRQLQVAVLEPARGVSANDLAAALL